MIQYLRHKEIDKQKWDVGICNALNGLVFAQSWYLDIVAPGWEALIENGYETLMPLPAKQKYGFPYLIQPRHTQQLGIFSPKPPTAEMVKQFLNHIPKKFVWSDFFLNSQNPVTNGTPLRINYELPLEKGYGEIYKGFNENTRRNIKKATQAPVLLKEENDVGEFMQLYSRHAKVKADAVALVQLKSIMEYALKNNDGFIVMANNALGQTIAGAFFLNALGRVIYLTSFNLDEGQKNAAMFLIMDAVIKKNERKPLVLDFEGSMVPGIARFFAGFGAKEITYPRYRHNILSFI